MTTPVKENFTTQQYQATSQTQADSADYTAAKQKFTTSAATLHQDKQDIDTLTASFKNRKDLTGADEKKLEDAINKFETDSRAFQQDSQSLTKIANADGRPDELKDANDGIAAGNADISSTVGDMRDTLNNTNLESIIGANGVNQLQTQMDRLISSANDAGQSGTFTKDGNTFQTGNLNDPFYANGKPAPTESGILSAFQNTSSGKSFYQGVSSDDQQKFAAGIQQSLEGKGTVTRADIESAVKASNVGQAYPGNDAALQATVDALAKAYNVSA